MIELRSILTSVLQLNWISNGDIPLTWSTSMVAE